MRPGRGPRRTIRDVVAAGDPHPTLRNRSVNEHSLALAHEWKRLGRLATAVGLMTSPILFALLVTTLDWPWYWCALGAFAAVVVFRGLVDVLAHRFIPAPTIYGAETELAKDDVIARRRLWYWRKKFRRTTFWGSLFLLVSLVVAVLQGEGYGAAMEEITRVVSLWQSGEEFEKAGGKREGGVLFLGPPGTGKTMLSKAIATSFNCPFVTIPGSGFAQTFIGMDAVIVRFLARKAKKLAAKWGGQCIVFIDEIDAVGMRRQSLGTGFQPYRDGSVHDQLFYGSDDALTT